MGEVMQNLVQLKGREKSNKKKEEGRKKGEGKGGREKMTYVGFQF